MTQEGYHAGAGTSHLPTGSAFAGELGAGAEEAGGSREVTPLSVLASARMTSPLEAERQIRELNEAAFDAAGVDLTQIDMMLAMTPRERLEALYETARSLARLMGDADAH
jgi:hypothetical protein